jgi:hypothetical protein
MITPRYILNQGDDMIKNVYITRINNEPGKSQFGFGLTEEGEVVYLTGFLVDTFDLSEDDLGTKNKMSVMPDTKDKADFVATAILTEDSALQSAYEWQKEEIERLQTLLDENGIEY